MKRITLIGVLIVVIMAVVGLVTAFNHGEPSPIYVSGTVSIPDELMPKAQRIETLYFIVFDKDSPSPMPYGAVRERLGPAIANGQSEFDFFITLEKLQVMNEFAPKPRRMRVKARFDLDGIAGPDVPGDIVGEIDEVMFGTHGVRIVADQYITDQ